MHLDEGQRRRAFEDGFVVGLAQPDADAVRGRRCRSIARRERHPELFFASSAIASSTNMPPIFLQVPPGT